MARYGPTGAALATSALEGNNGRAVQAGHFPSLMIHFGSWEPLARGAARRALTAERIERRQRFWRPTWRAAHGGR